MTAVTAAAAPLHAPHRLIKVSTDKERFLIDLFDTLWERYRERVEHVRRYEAVVLEHGAVFVNDHIAFRTLAAQEPTVGTLSIARLVEALGYRAAACYGFPDKHLDAVHLQHPNPQFPKVFISQLRTWELTMAGRRIVEKSLKDHRAALPDATLAALHGLDKVTSAERAKLLKMLARFFAALPWEAPQKKDVLDLDRESQYAAWVLLNGYDVNHFTASVDSHGVPALGDIEKTVAALLRAGVPMKAEIEGERGSKLRQSATEPVRLEVAVKQGHRPAKLPWTYGYFELAERPLMTDPLTGRQERFQGFLGGQAAQLFEMTKVKP